MSPRASLPTRADRHGVERQAVEIIASDVQLLDKKAAAQATGTGNDEPPGTLDEPF
mgnify:CR=1 FL=1